MKVNPFARFAACWSVAFLLFVSVESAAAGGIRLSVNPYAGVNWERATQHKANLHTHTVASGGKLFLETVYAEYAKRGYTILAITDHDLCTRWWKADVDPAKYGIFPVLGQEYSEGDHVNGYFLDYKTGTTKTPFLVEEIAGHGGVSVLNHPGRYWKPDAEGKVPQETLGRYLAVLRDNPSVLGIEVLNKSDRYPTDMVLWDALLQAAMPSRPILGFANDDMHESDQIGHSWETFLLDTLDEKVLRQALTEGRFYLSSRGRSEEESSYPPIIQSVIHDPVAQTLVIAAAADGGLLTAENYRWVSGGTTIHTGPALNYGQARGIVGYVRAELTGKGGTTYTNPFGFTRDAAP